MINSETYKVTTDTVKGRMFSTLQQTAVWAVKTLIYRLLFKFEPSKRAVVRLQKFF